MALLARQFRHLAQRRLNPLDDPRDPAWRPPLDRSLPFPPEGEVDHPNLKEMLFANLSAEQIVADVGCGPGPFEYDNYASKFLAYDAFPPSSTEGMKPGDEFELTRIDEFPAPDASIDAVVMGFILEHVEEPMAFVAEANRVLKPGGWCYIAIPNGDSIEDRLFRSATTIAGSTRGPHIQKFTFAGFRESVEKQTSLRLEAWHLLPASYLWMTHPKLNRLRRPFIGMMRGLRRIGIDGFRNANFQLLFRKAGE